VKGEHVADGAVLGRIVDYFGQSLEEIRAPFAGEILYVVETPPITKGEPIGMVGSTLKS
jgi:predicted deacylase